MRSGMRISNGKTRFFNETIKGKRKYAQSLETKKKREMDLGIFIEHSSATVNEYLDKWLDISAKSKVKARTFYDYVEYLKRYVRPVLGTRQLSKLKPLDIQSLYTSMLERGLSARTVRYTHAILSSALKQAVKWQITNSNPASMTDLPQIHRKEMNVLSAGDCASFLRAAGMIDGL